MLQELRIVNLILIESAEIHFTQGLNVLSGETGSGKSAIMKALELVSGERADPSVIRKGASKGLVEALILPPKSSFFSQHLDEIGIEYTPNEPLLLRREISATGKSRALINDQAVTISQLKLVCAFLIEITGQHANQMLLSPEQHRRMLDNYAGVTAAAQQFQASWLHENALRKKLEELIQSEGARLREIERLEHEWEELSEAAIKEGEEEDLFAEYTLLTNAEERSQKAREIYNGLSGEKSGALTLLRKQKTVLDQLEGLDGSIAEAVKLHQSALLELEEVSYLFNQYQSRIEASPDKIQALEERLKLINTLKKKYGGTILELIAYSASIKKRLADLDKADQQIEAVREELAKVEGENDQKASTLTKQRTEAAQRLAAAVQTELAALNMPKALFSADILPQARSGSGDEKIEFFLAPNVGEHRISVKDCASGGELSRLMLALQTLLAGKASIPTLIFDEIDSNVGGATAVVVGEKLKQISKQHQVLCITHFPQVAQYCDHHLQISKCETDDGRTVTLIASLDKKTRTKELNRMSGKI